MHASLAALAGDGPALVVVDLSGLSFRDSWALGVVLRTAQDLHEAGSAVALAGPQAGVARVLQISGADTIVAVYPSVQEATAR
ncbi:MAG TPA: STAS domain-containing protein [Trebonia sp.]